MIQRLIVLLLVVYLTAVVFAPPIPGNDWLRYDDLILLVAVTVAALPRLKDRTTRSSNSGHVLLIIGFIYLILLTTLFSSLLAGFVTVYDYGGLAKELLRLGKYALVVFFALAIVDKRHRRFVTYWIVILAVLVVFTQVAQYFGDVSFNQTFARIYGEQHHFAAALAPMSRERGYFYAGGPFGNPNVASSFLVMPFFLLLFLVFSSFMGSQDEKQYSLKKRMLLIVLTSVLLVGILLSDSRAAMISVLIAASFYLLIGRTGRGRIASLIVIIIPLILLMLFAPILTNKGLFVGHLLEGLAGGSISVKMLAFQNGFRQLTDNRFWWGYGAASGPHVDFEVAYFVIWYGFLGVIIYFLLWFGMMWGVLSHKEAFEEWAVVFVIILTAFVMNFSQSTYLNNRVFPIFVVMILMNFTGKILKPGKEAARSGAMRTPADVLPS